MVLPTRRWGAGPAIALAGLVVATGLTPAPATAGGTPSAATTAGPQTTVSNIRNVARDAGRRDWSCPFPAGRSLADRTPPVRATRLTRDDGHAGPGSLWQPGELLVQFRAPVPPRVRRCMARYVTGTVLDPRVPRPGTVLLRVRPGVSVDRAVTAMRRQERYVTWASPNLVAQPLDKPRPPARGRLPNDPLVPRFDAKADWSAIPAAERLAKMWHLTCGCWKDPQTGKRYFAGTSSDLAWRWFNETGSAETEIGVIDTGLDGRPVSDFWRYDTKAPWYQWWRNKRNLAGSEDLLPSDGHAGKVVRQPNGSMRVVVSGEWPGPHQTCTKKDDPSTCTDDVDDHGTAVASLIAGYGDNGRGGSGVMWRAGLLPVSISGSQKHLAATIEAIDYLGRRGTRVVNLSLGFPAGEPDDVTGLAQAMGRYPDTLWVWAAGNDGIDVGFRDDQNPYRSLASTYLPPKSGFKTGRGRYRADFFDHQTWKGLMADKRFPLRDKYASTYPCALRRIDVQGQPFQELGPYRTANRGNMICVAANDLSGQLSFFSNYGSSTVEFSAPGEDLLVAGSGTKAGTYTTGSGTSFAAPLVTGIAGLVLSEHPEFSPVEVKCVLMQAAERSPLPPQDITKPRHPAFLQLPDQPYKDEALPNKPVNTLAEFQQSDARLGADGLLRVMGIPSAYESLVIADRLALSHGVGPVKGRTLSPCHAA